MSRFISNRLAPLSAYVPGEQPKPGEFIKLNTNEFPYPPAPNVEKSAETAVETMNLYSDLRCTRLKEEFERVFGFGEGNVIFTNGSDESLYLCFLTFCDENCGAAFADITYGFYSVYADLCCIEKKVIPLDSEFGINPADYKSVGMTIFIANPNAPTGKALTVEEIEAIIVSNPSNIVVIDEAYADFSGVSCRELTRKYDNLIVVGTFSKSRGMAGARLGYLIASPELVADIEKVKYSINPYNVNSLTQTVGTAVLESNEYYAERVKSICDTRDWFAYELTKLGFSVIPSKTNFVFASHDTVSGKHIFEELRNKRILIRRFDSERISNYLRISIGTRDEMERVVTALKSILGGNK